MPSLKPLLAALLIAANALASPAVAQTPQRNLPAQIAAMAKLDALKGRWLGQGERFLPDGSRYNFAQTMNNDSHSGGLVLTLQGLSLRQGEPDANRPGTGSFAVITFDDRAGVYQFRSFGFGEMVEANAELVDASTFRWTTAVGPAMLRFTIDLSRPGIWNETGERSIDGGKSWQTTNRLIAYRTETR
jgi:hypothetical protein